MDALLWHGTFFLKSMLISTASIPSGVENIVFCVNHALGKAKAPSLGN